MNLVQRSASTIAARGIAYVFTMAAGIAIARVLGPADRGIYAVLTNAVSILIAVGLLGIESANIYYAARRHNISGLVSNSLVVGLGAGVLLATSLLIFYQLTQGRLFPGLTVLLVAVAVAAVPPFLLHTHLSGILWGLSRITTLNLLSVAAAILQLIAIVLTVAFLKLGLLELLTINLSLAALNVAALLFLLKRMPQIHFALALDWSLMRQMARFSLAAYGANVFWLLAIRVDVLLINILVGGAALGHYAMAVAMTQLMLLIPQSVQRVLFAQFSGSSPAEANHLIPLASRTLIVLMIALSLLAAMLAAPAVRLVLGMEYGPTAGLFALLLPGVVASSLLGVSSAYFTGRGRPEVPMLVSLAMLVAIISLDLALIPRMGVTGAALAASGSSIASAAVELSMALRWSNTSLREALLLKPEDLRYIRTQLFARFSEPTV